MLDYPRLKRKFGAIANKAPDEIIAELVDMGQVWREDEPLVDDCTFVVIKVNNN